MMSSKHHSTKNNRYRVTESFAYQNKIFTCENIPLPDIAARAGTPLYVYSTAELQRRARAFRQGGGEGVLIHYAVKANGNPAILKLLKEKGLGADVTSGGELFLALEAGIEPHKIIYSGVGKRTDEIEMALHAGNESTGIGALHVESEMEFERVAAAAAGLKRVARIAMRVNPDIGAETHPYDSTGRLAHKFGVPRETAVALYQQAALNPWLQPVGLAAHIGSQITRLEPYRELVTFLLELAGELVGQGIDLSYIDAGGGLGIDYGANETVPEIAEWVSDLARPVLRAGYHLVIEPGRAIVGPAGLLLTRVLYTKKQGGKSFIIVDAGMNDLVRPAMYNAHHPIWPVCLPGDGETLSLQDVVGPVCETGDFLARDRPLPEMAPGRLLAVMQAGAYGFAMSSNYNGRLRPAEVLVHGDQFQVIRRRQTYQHLLDGI
jgi:diaminopimelate decarboxylase